MVAVLTSPPKKEEMNAAYGKGTRVPWYIRPPEDVYFIQRVLGTGHYGVVCAATHKETGEIYAIKSLDKAHPEYNFDEVRNEVNVLARVCDHPNIATLYEVYEDAEHIYLVQEACLGGELFDLVVERKHFTEGDAGRVASVLVSVVAHCHNRGVLHRDIKPENFLVKGIVPEEGRFNGSDVRAVDFGLSMMLNEKNRPTDIVGSSYYIAPEVLGGQPFGPAADCWSLGVVVFILISGYPPFWGSSDNIIYDRIQNQELDMGYEPWTTDAVSSQAADFVRRLLTKDPTKRMTAEEARQHPWLTDAASAPDEAPLAPSIVDRLRAFTRQNRLTCLLMTLVAHHLSDADIIQLRRTFYELDTDNDGLIDVATISEALQTVGVDTQKVGIADLVAGLDVGHNHAGQVNVDEFLAAALDRKKIFTKTTVAAVFKRLDHKGEGMLSMAALSTALAECGIPVAENTLRTMMAREGALDGAGVVSARSFQNLLVAGAEVHQNRPAAVALERILSGGLNYEPASEDPADAWRSVLAPRTLTLSTSRRSSLDGDETPREGRSTGATLDEVLRQYSISGFKTPRRRGSLAGSPTLSASPSPMAGKYQNNNASHVSTPTSCPSPSVACLGFD